MKSLKKRFSLCRVQSAVPGNRQQARQQTSVERVTTMSSLFHVVAASVMACMLVSCGGGEETTSLIEAETVKLSTVPRVADNCSQQGQQDTCNPLEQELASLAEQQARTAPERNSFDDVSVSRRWQPADPDKQAIADYLALIARGGPWYAGPSFTWTHPPGLSRFDAIPVVRVSRNASDEQYGMVAHAVALINRALPYDQHVGVLHDAPPLAAIEDVPTGEIFVDFVPSEDWILRVSGRPGSSAVAQGDYIQQYDHDQSRWEKKSVRAGHVWMDWNLPEWVDPSDLDRFSVVLHELIHTLGIAGHVPQGEFPDSIMRDQTLLTADDLPTIDGRALRALYGHYPNGTEPEDVSELGFGPWGDYEAVLTGRLSGIEFGVRWHDGLSVPFASGIQPSRDLQDNTALHGVVTWRGGLLGFTPDMRSVAGNARLTIDIEHLDGHADFTQLESWPVGHTPGELGGGMPWHLGRLGYTIVVSDNYFRSTGGDDGTVNGQFYGFSHNTAAGSVERADLAAAFGARR